VRWREKSSDSVVLVLPQNGHSRPCLSKTVASLPSLVVEAHGQGSQNGRILSQAEGGRRGSCGKKELRHQMFIVGYLQFVERQHLHATLCSTGYRLSAVASKLHSRLSTGGIATPVKPSGSSQGDGSNV